MVRLIPRLDIKGPNLIKSIQLEGLRIIGDPNFYAKKYYNQGADELLYMDCVASLYGRNSLKKLITKSTENVFIPITVGGGIRQISDMIEMLEAGCDKVSVNTAAIENPTLIQEASKYFGSQCIVSAIDAKSVFDLSEADLEVLTANDGYEEVSLDKSSRWEVYTHGGRNRTGIDAVKWAKLMSKLGAGELLVTSMDQDGHKSGYDIQQLFEISSSVQIPVIASGGAGEYQHLFDALQSGLADAVLAASIFHSKTHSISGAKQFLSELGIPIRPLEQMEESE